MNISKNILSEKRIKSCFLVNFNIIVSYIFAENFTEISRLSEDMNFHFFDFLLIFQFFGFFTFTWYKKTNDISICKIIPVLFWLELLSIGFLRIAFFYCDSLHAKLNSHYKTWGYKKKKHKKIQAYRKCL